MELLTNTIMQEVVETLEHKESISPSRQIKKYCLQSKNIKAQVITTDRKSLLIDIYAKNSLGMACTFKLIFYKFCR